MRAFRYSFISLFAFFLSAILFGAIARIILLDQSVSQAIYDIASINSSRISTPAIILIPFLGISISAEVIERKNRRARAIYSFIFFIAIISLFWSYCNWMSIESISIKRWTLSSIYPAYAFIFSLIVMVIALIFSLSTKKYPDNS